MKEDETVEDETVEDETVEDDGRTLWSPWPLEKQSAQWK